MSGDDLGPYLHSTSFAGKLRCDVTGEAQVVREDQVANVCYCSSYTPQNPGMIIAGAQVHGAVHAP